MSNVFHLDYEVKSCIDLSVRGADNYFRDPSTTVLMAAYAEGDHKVKLWQPHLEPRMPNELRDALTDPFVTVAAWNAGFERGITKFVQKIDKPINEWTDPMISARYLSIPGSLDEAGKILGLSQDQAKIKDGSRLISKFCMPAVEASEGLFGMSAVGFRDWSTDPDDWESFCQYCVQDVVAERTILKKLSKFPMPESEWEMWYLDQKINEAGLPVDVDVVSGANVIVAQVMEKLIKRLKDLTGLDNPNSNDQMLEWVRAQGYPFGSLNKEFVKRAMGEEGAEMSPLGREVLEIREQTSKSSVKKYTSIGEIVSPDGRIRHQFSFMGASRTGRWASRGINLQNLPRPTKAVEKKMSLALELLKNRDLEGIEREFPNPLEVVTSTLRSAFKAPDGYKLAVCDLNAVENRVIGFGARCAAILNVFHENRCPYLDFAVEMYGRPYAELHHEWKVLKISDTRNKSKPATLGCGFRLSGGEEMVNEKGDKYLSGLLGYANAMGVVMTKEEADRAVSIFRKKYPEVVQLWYDIENASIAAMEHPGQWFGVGNPVNERDRQRYIDKGRDPDRLPILSFKATGKRVLEMKLPSGRSLHYINPILHVKELEGKNGTYKKKSISYEGREQKSRAWTRIDTHGGKFCENGVQAIARDLLVNGMKLADKKGLPIILHVHDEIGCLVPVDSPLGLKDLEECMRTPPEWSNGELPLGCEGYEDVVYKKG